MDIFPKISDDLMEYFACSEHILSNYFYAEPPPPFFKLGDMSPNLLCSYAFFEFF